MLSGYDRQVSAAFQCAGSNKILDLTIQKQKCSIGGAKRLSMATTPSV